MTSVWQAINESASQAVTQARQSLVQIVTNEGGIGAGVIWHQDGLIITNAHVIMGAKKQKMAVLLQDGSRHEIQLLATDPERDLSALAIQTGYPLPAIVQGNSADLSAGQWLMAIGHPWGVLDAITAGVVIGTGKDLPEVGDEREWLALDMQMRPGHSGGILFNDAGEIVGINTMIRGPEVSFAVPVDVVKHFIAETIGTFQASSQAAVYEPEPASTAMIV